MGWKVRGWGGKYCKWIGKWVEGGNNISGLENVILVSMLTVQLYSQFCPKSDGGTCVCLNIFGGGGGVIFICIHYNSLV